MTETLADIEPNTSARGESPTDFESEYDLVSLPGWIKLHRQIVEWEWFSDANVVKLFIYLLCKANFRAKRWRGFKIGRGQLITGRLILAANLNFSLQELKTALHKLESTGEITRKSTNKFTILTLCNYERYQGRESVEQPTNNQRTTNEQQTNNKRTTNEQPQLKKDKKDKKERREEDIPGSKGAGLLTISPLPSDSGEAFKTPKTPKVGKPVFNPDGKKQVKEWVYLTPEQFDTALARYRREGLDFQDWDDGLTLLNDWFAQNPHMRAKRVDDGAALRGWVLKELLDRRVKRLRLQRQESFNDGGNKK